MALLKPFAALRPQPELAAQICELPYDVMSSDEARAMADGNPLSFLHVSKPEIDLPAGTDLYSPEVYAKGAENFASLIARGALKQDDGILAIIDGKQQLAQQAGSFKSAVDKA